VISSARISDSVRVVLIVLADEMTDTGYVSVPRQRLAALLNRSPRRITERLEKAREAGYLDVVQRGRPGRTAEYQATLPKRSDSAPVRTISGSTQHHLMVRSAAPIMVPPSAPCSADGLSVLSGLYGADGGPANTRALTNARRQHHGNQRHSGGERDDQQEQERSDGRGSTRRAIAAVLTVGRAA
jgi:hypothetical protein